jgi:integrase/recombinase XerD
MHQLRIDDLLPDIGSVATLKQGLAFYETVGMPARHLAKRTRAEYSSDLADLCAFLERGGVTTLTQVRLSDLEAYQAELDRRELRASSRNRKTYAIKTFFHFLYEQGVLFSDFTSRLIPPPVERNEPRVLSETEYKALQQACRQSTRDAAIIELYLQSGMTLTEVVRLTVQDIELPNRISQDSDNTGMARVRRRRGNIEYIPLNYKVCQVLAKYLAERSQSPSAYLFLSRRNRALSKRAVQYVVVKYLEQIGIRNASVRTLRHTMATHHVARGTKLSTVQETLGLSSIDSTEVYVSLAKQVQRKALQEHAL